MIISAIAAVAENGTIGRDGDLPWHLPDDMAYFQRTTMGHHVVTGRKNYESIPAKYRPLKGRTNLVISRDPAYQAPGAVVLTSMQAAAEHALKAGETELFVIGGGQIYQEAFRLGLVDLVHLTRVHAEVPGDTQFPELDPTHWREASRTEHAADDRHVHAFTILVLDRI